MAKTTTASAFDARPTDLRRTMIVAVLVLAVLLLVALAVLSWLSGKDEIDATYGVPSGMGSGSVNGALVLYRMCEDVGYRLKSTSTLTPRIANEADAIVWFDNVVEIPNQEVLDWFDAWLSDVGGRTLIYVGRDFDAEPSYWEAIAPQVPSTSRREVGRRMLEARARASNAWDSSIVGQKCDWFEWKELTPPLRVDQLEGDPAWVAGIDPKQLNITIRGYLEPPPEAEALVSCQGIPLVSRVHWNNSQLLLVANGAFTLNLPLVNHEHRKLAGKLIGELPTDDPGLCVFPVNHYGQLGVMHEDEKDAAAPSMFFTAPFNWVFLHMAIAALVYCLARAPIFGLARPLIEEHLSDFGKHAEALGLLYGQTRSAATAHARIEQYRQMMKRIGSRRDTAVDVAGRVAAKSSQIAAAAAAAAATSVTIDPAEQNEMD